MKKNSIEKSEKVFKIISLLDNDHEVTSVAILITALMAFCAKKDFSYERLEIIFNSSLEKYAKYFIKAENGQENTQS